MDIKDMRYYQLIGDATSAVRKADNLDEAIRNSLSCFVESGLVDYAVSWRTETDEQKELRSFYWICPVDLTRRTCRLGEGCVGRAFLNQKTEIIHDVNANADRETLDMFADIPVSGLICIPLFIDNRPLGCIELIRTAEHEHFNEDEVNVCEIVVMMIQMNISEQFPQIAAEEKSVLLSARNIHKYYQSGETKTHVIKGFNLDIFRKEMVCFLGESGCGKSTMLNIFGGLLDFDEGSLLFEGQELKDAGRDKLTEYRRDNIGFVFQSYNLMPNLNAKHNIELIGELSGNPMDALELLEAVGLKGKENYYPARLSGGQQQRVAIARALVKRPKLILADEPTAALDYSTSIEVLEAFQKARDYGTSIIIVSHNNEIAKMADRVVRFRNGKMYETVINAKPKKPSELVW